MIISWAPGHGRTEGLATYLGLHNRYIYPAVPVRRFPLVATAIRYFLSLLLTSVQLFRARARDCTVIVVAPPVFPVLLARVILKPDRLIIDAHSGAFVGKKWRWSVPLLRRSCRGSAGLIVTNEQILKGISVDCEVFVIHDLFEHWDRTDPAEPGYVLVPLGGGDDEPVETILSAVRQSGLPVVLSGRGYPDSLPSNAQAVGFVPIDEYRDYVRKARVVVALTMNDFTMQRVGYEAMFAGRALVTSDFEVLRQFFGEAAVYVTPDDANSIARGVTGAWNDADHLSAAMRAVQASRAEQQAATMETLRSRMRRSGCRETP